MEMVSPSYGRISVLISCAQEVSVLGPFLACRRAIPIMLEQGGGRIVNTASEAGLRGGTAGTPYTVSKHGVVGLTKSIAFHYGDQGIRCNAVCPGSVETAIGLGGSMVHEAGLNKVMAMVQGSASGGLAKPEQLASAIAFLASDDSSNVNGAILAGLRPSGGKRKKREKKS